MQIPANKIATNPAQESLRANRDGGAAGADGWVFFFFEAMEILIRQPGI